MMRDNKITGGVEDDLLPYLGRLFAAKEAELIAAFKVFKPPDKGAPPATAPPRIRAPLAAGASPDWRVLSITWRQSNSAHSGGKTALNILRPFATKDGQLKFQLRRVVVMKQVSVLEVLAPSVRLGRTVRFLQVCLDAASELQEAGLGAGQEQADRIVFGSYTDADRMDVLSTLYRTCQIIERQTPLVIGVDPAQVSLWWTSRLERHTDLPFITALGAELLAPEPTAGADTDEAPGKAGAKVRAGVMAMSSKEERDLNELMQMFCMGLQNVGALQERLQSEYHAHESANIHSLLESGPLVQTVLAKLDNSQGLLDDLEANLSVFSKKLRYMRRDIQVIERYNNDLERSASNRQKLEGVLSGLLDALQLPGATLARLRDPDFSQAARQDLLEAGWLLCSKLAELQAAKAGGPVGPQLLQLEAVQSGRSRLQRLAAGLQESGAAYISKQLFDAVHEIEKAMADGSRLLAEGAVVSGVEALLGPDGHSRYHRVGRQQQGLIQLLLALDPAGLPALWQRLVQPLQKLVRSELRISTECLRAAVRQDLATSQPEVDLLHRRRADGDEGDEPRRALVRAASSTHLLGPRVLSKSAGSSVAATVGKGKPLPAYRAWATLLNLAMPLIVEEAGFTADLFLLRDPPADAGGERGSLSPCVCLLSRFGTAKLSKQGKELVSSLLDFNEVENFLQRLLDLAAQEQALHALPMQLTTLLWMDALSCVPTAAPALAVLAKCSMKQKAAFTTWLEKRELGIRSWASSASSSPAIKTLHVVSFVSSFPTVVGRLLELLKVASTAPLVPQAGLSEADGSEQGAASLMSKKLNNVDQDAFNRLLLAIQKTVEDMAKTDEKHAARFQMENLEALAQGLGRLESGPLLLRRWQQQLQQQAEQALAVYVTQQLVYGQLSPLLDFSRRLEQMLKDLLPEEVAFQKEFSAAGLRSVLSATVASGLDRKLTRMLQRIRKHLDHPDSVPGLVRKVWKALQDELVQQYEQLQQMAAKCYPSMELRPSAAELLETFKLVDDL